MKKECVNCPGATDHSTAECPAMRAANEVADQFTKGFFDDRMVRHVAEIFAKYCTRASLPVGVPDGLIDELRNHAAARTGYTTDLIGRAADVIEKMLEPTSDRWASHKEKFCGCKDASRLNQCRGLDNCELPCGHPDRKTAAPTVKAEQVQCGTCNGTALIGDLPTECPDCCHDEAPSLPAAGSPAQEFDFIIEDRDGMRVIEWKYGGCRPASTSECAMWDALSAQQSAPERVSVVTEGKAAIDWEVVEFLRGCGELHGLHFSETLPGMSPFWWRAYLPNKTNRRARAPERVSVPVELAERILDYGDAEIAVFRDDNNGPGEWMCPACEGYSNATYRDGKRQPFPGIAHADDCWLEELRALLASHAEGGKV